MVNYHLSVQNHVRDQRRRHRPLLPVADLHSPATEPRADLHQMRPRRGLPMPPAPSASVAVPPPCSTPEPFSNSGRIRHSIVTPSLCNRTSLSPTSALNGIWFRNCFSFSNVIKRLLDRKSVV